MRCKIGKKAGVVILSWIINAFLVCIIVGNIVNLSTATLALCIATAPIVVYVLDSLLRAT